jgi:hypothetical protein
VIREYEVKEKIQQEGLTPIRPRKREEDTPSHIEDHPARPSDANDSLLSKSNFKYDIYFNAKEYDRLQKEYNEFRANAAHHLEELERSL